MKSFLALAKELLREFSDENIFILSEKFLQDPLEEHFAEHRRRGGCRDNPTLDQFQDQALYLNWMKSRLIDNLRGNTSVPFCEIPKYIYATQENYLREKVNRFANSQVDV